MFILLVAAEIYGRKHNIELGFPERPSLADFIGHCEATFRGEVARVRPSGAPLHRFVIDSVKIFDDTLNRWVDLASAHQLVEWSQLYLFQPSVDPTNPNEESQAILQAPVRIRSPMEVGRNKEKFFFLFHDMDFNGNGHLNRDEIQRIFNVLGCFEISEKSIDQYFLQFDTNRDGVLSFAEFTKWMTAKPEVAEMLLKKSLEYWQSWRRRRPEIRDSSEVSAQERAAIEQYLERCRAAQSNPASQQRIRTIKEIDDERLLLEREEELRRARDQFKSTYGRDLGVPSSASRKVSSSSTNNVTLMMKQQQSASSSNNKNETENDFNNNNGSNKRSQNNNSAAAPTSGATTPKRATTPTSSAANNNKNKTAFGSTMEKTTPRVQTKASTAPKKRENNNNNNSSSAVVVAAAANNNNNNNTSANDVVPPSPSPVVR
jgi:hypothetical protein